MDSVSVLRLQGFCSKCNFFLGGKCDPQVPESKRDGVLPQGSAEVISDGPGTAGLSPGTPSLSPAGLHLPICEVTGDGVLVPPFLKEGRKTPLCYAHPVIWGRWQPRGTEDAAPPRHSHRQQQRVCGKTPPPHRMGIWTLFSFGDSAPNGYGGGARGAPSCSPARL